MSPVALGALVVLIVVGGSIGQLQRTQWLEPVWWVVKRVGPFLAKWLVLSLLPLLLIGVVQPGLDGKPVTLDSIVGEGQLLWPVVGLTGGSLWTLLSKHAVVKPPSMVAGLGMPAVGVAVTSAWLVGHPGLVNPPGFPWVTVLSLVLLVAGLMVGGGTALVSEP